MSAVKSCIILPIRWNKNIKVNEINVQLAKCDLIFNNKKTILRLIMNNWHTISD